jgi:hypothetical protein
VISHLAGAVGPGSLAAMYNGRQEVK